MKTHFVKIHGPWETLCNTAEEMMMQMPIKVRRENVTGSHLEV